MPKVFISYSQDSKEHCKNIADFAAKLIEMGIDTEIDQYTTNPKEGWPMYMLRNILESDYVLCACTETYKNRFEQDETVGKGKGAKFEGKTITQIIYDNEVNTNIIPVFIGNTPDIDYIPQVLRPYTYYNTSNDANFVELYEILSGQTKSKKPKLGAIVPIEDLRKRYNLQSYTEKEIDKIKKTCIARFKANGLSEKKACELFELNLNAEKYSYVLPENNDVRSVYVIGDFGAGKSLALSILYLQKIKSNSPALFINAIDLPKDGQLSKCLDIDKINKKTTIFIDSLDDVDYELAKRIIEDIIKIETFNKYIEFIVSSRPNIAIDERCVKVLIKPLSLDESIDIIQLISDNRVSMGTIYGWDENLKETICNPFFSIIVGLYFTKRSEFYSVSKQALIKYLIQHSLSLYEENETLYSHLKQLSVKCIQMQQNKILLSELGNSVKLRDIIKTGLIQLEEDYISFSLPIIPQWLASEAIRDKEIDIDEIIKDDATIIRWRYPLMLLMGNISYEESTLYFSKIVNKYPSVASIIIRDNLNIEDISILPNSETCARMITDCMKEWVNSLGILAKYIAPFDGDKLCTLGIIVNTPQIEMLWGKKNYGKEYEIVTETSQFDFFSYSSIHIGKSSLWPWIITFNQLSYRLNKLIDNQPLFLDIVPLREERMYDIARILSNKGSLYCEDIELSNFDKYISNHNFGISGYYIDAVEYFFNYINELKVLGKNKIEYPYLKPDLPLSSGGYVWDVYSNERKLLFIEQIYKKALDCYYELCSGLFCNLSRSMPMFNMLPATMVIKYSICKGDIPFPSIYWHLECKDKSAKNDIKFDNTGDDRIQEYNLIKNSIDRFRRSKQEWCSITLHSELLRIFHELPLTKIIFDWLKSDLKKIGWIE